MEPGRIIAISGAAGGLGPTVARAFFQAGAALAVAGRTAQSLGALLDSIGVPAGRRLASAVDLSDGAATAAWAREVVSRFGRVDVMLHLVGGYAAGTTIGAITDAEWGGVEASLVRTTLNVARAFAGPLKESGSGRFVAVTSSRTQAPAAKNAVYAMGKAASDALVLALADELRGTGATANLVVVDSIDVPERRGTEPKKPYGKSTPAEEIAAAMLFLCSEQAATINGVRLPLIGRG